MQMESLTGLGYRIVKEFFLRTYPKDVDLFEWTWDLVRDKVLPVLANTHPTRWSLKASGVDISALAAVGEAEPLPVSMAAILMTLATVYHVSDTERPPTREDLARIVGSYGTRFRVTGEVMEDLKDFLIDRVIAETQPAGATTARRATGTHSTSLGEQIYKVFIDGQRKTANAQEVDDLRKRKGEFDLWWDRETDELLVQKKPKPLRAQLQTLLSLVIEFDGKVLRDETVEKTLWPADKIVGSHVVDAVFWELFKATEVNQQGVKHKIINKKNVRSIKKLSRHMVQLNIHYCCVTH